MKTLPLILAAICLALCSCATRVYENGLPVLATYSNSSYLKFRTPRGTQLEMHNVDNSTPTRAGFESAGNFAVKTGLGGAGMMMPVR